MRKVIVLIASAVVCALFQNVVVRKDTLVGVMATISGVTTQYSVHSHEINRHLLLLRLKIAQTISLMIAFVRHKNRRMRMTRPRSKQQFLSVVGLL
jgi:hypothetical protein